MLEKTFIYSRDGFAVLYPIEVRIDEEFALIQFHTDDLMKILPFSEAQLSQIATYDGYISVEKIKKLIKDNSAPECIDFDNWFTYELMPNIINSINQMPVEVIIKHEQ